MRDSAIVARTSDTIDIISADDDQDDKAGPRSKRYGPHSSLYARGAHFKAQIHLDLLCFFSPYHRAALKGVFLEAQHNTVILEMDPVCCDIFVKWRYTGCVPNDDPWALCQLYILADQNENLALRRAILTQIVNVDFAPDLNDSNTAAVVSSLPENSALTRYLLDRTSYHQRAETIQIHTDMPVEFVETLKELIKKPRHWLDDCPCCNKPCNYHEHNIVEDWKLSCAESGSYPMPEPAYLRAEI
ncbi:hypothetical protein D6D22_10742 [Aureobasidium pullulans]|uniref:BTB domain-containing protein n=1 Tax=Aureobasidium pullulans TaxID=5580 RepID=A0A4S9EMA9_AURPU|nr:hypothetical protein D6D22_10742 [Aureobasidium pullulans]THX23402.1 hypothetical protein D6D11_10539 [Aureobasidium pullulans]THX34803.1 hypothetical protein D6D12_00763 [Aureobasidium pullulans]THX69989.1 hypothetical protein D6D08_05865 [Aureobasidium pullulans]